MAGAASSQTQAEARATSALFWKDEINSLGIFGDDGFDDRWNKLKIAVEGSVITTEVLVEIVPLEFICRLCRDAIWQVQRLADKGTCALS